MASNMRLLRASSVLGCARARSVLGVRRPCLARCPGGSVRCSSSANGLQQAEGGANTYTITTPLYYVNAGSLTGTSSAPSAVSSTCVTVRIICLHAAPHMGSAYSTIAADTAARFQVCVATLPFMLHSAGDPAFAEAFLSLSSPPIVEIEGAQGALRDGHRRAWREDCSCRCQQWPQSSGAL